MSSEDMKLYKEESGSYAADSYFRVDERVIAEQYFKGKHILVLGCGGGRTLSPLYDMGIRVTAIDIVPEMVAESKKRIKDRDIEIYEMDATNLSFGDATFDAVFFPFHGIDYVQPDIYASVSEACRVMKQDGVFVFSSHNRYFLKKLHRFFKGKVDTYKGHITYRTDLNDRRKLRRYFSEVVVIQRISFLPWGKANWRDKLYKLLPFFSKSTYFICKSPRNV